MVTAGAAKGNDWQSQPRDPETGRFEQREKGQPRSEMIQLRLTPRERQQIEADASAMGMTLTAWLVYKALT